MYANSEEEYNEMMSRQAYAESEAAQAQYEAELQYQEDYETAKRFLIEESNKDKNFAMLSGTMPTIINAMINYKYYRKPQPPNSDDLPF